MSAKDTRKLIASHSVLIDPMECNSTIAYKIVDEVGDEARSGQTVSAQVILSDCNRMVSWEFSKYDAAANNLAKIDRAIAELTDFREELTAAYTRSSRRKRNVA